MDHRKLGRNPSHRKALLRNMMNSLVLSERIETTVPKAKELRRLADRLVTLGKRGTLHARRRAFALLSDKETTDKLFATLAGRFVGREGGYTRIVRTGYRVGDGAELAILEYLPAEEKKAAAKGKRKAPVKKGAEKPAAGKKSAVPGEKKKTKAPTSREKETERKAPRSPRKKVGEKSK